MFWFKYDMKTIVEAPVFMNYSVFIFKFCKQFGTGKRSKDTVLYEAETAFFAEGRGCTEYVFGIGIITEHKHAVDLDTMALECVNSFDDVIGFQVFLHVKETVLIYGFEADKDDFASCGFQFFNQFQIVS